MWLCMVVCVCWGVCVCVCECVCVCVFVLLCVGMLCNCISWHVTAFQISSRFPHCLRHLPGYFSPPDTWQLALLSARLFPKLGDPLKIEYVLRKCGCVFVSGYENVYLYL